MKKRLGFKGLSAAKWIYVWNRRNNKKNIICGSNCELYVFIRLVGILAAYRVVELIPVALRSEA